MMDSEKQPLLLQGSRTGKVATSPRLRIVTLLLFSIASIALIVASCLQLSVLFEEALELEKSEDCLDPELGYTCLPKTSRFWGQYSPYWKVPSEIPNEAPEGCEITFAQILSRHGARDPTLDRTLRLVTTITRVKSLARLRGKYAFIKDYLYDLGADQLNELGRRELRQSGKQAHSRYSHLGEPFIRASSQQRVVDSAISFIDGFGTDLNITVLQEGMKSNDTLAHSRCPSIERGPISNVRTAARTAWGNVFLPPIAARLTKDLHMDITQDDAHNLMSMCPMTTVHDPKGIPTKFCYLFTHEEWRQYNHFESLEKYYGWGKGNPLGPTQGVGFVNELIARMLRQPVNDWTSTNHTLNNNPATFPLDKNLYADFSHDDDLTAIFFAAGLFSTTPTLSITQVDSTNNLNGWSPARTVPFAGRAYFEKMKCKGNDQELVRAVVNDRVIPLELCKPDQLGRCTLKAFIDSLSFARKGGNWPMCYIMNTLDAKIETTLEGILLNGAGSLEVRS